MSHLSASDPHHAAIRAEMRQLRLNRRPSYPALVLGLVAAADAASVVLTLSGL
ncbi:hypothetical protein [Enterovirga aerilata]|uniref:Uncharacterized protein n=1 Tax=Enterovirga aerilata TaxID=2730920 RepID=A0A849I8F2_9HYPH|nr:hypothetical protein [Enterovirga sp. DB1703]NNM72277.1 hypothetical protein [Enterovirga sp. DB1703]